MGLSFLDERVDDCVSYDCVRYECVSCEGVTLGDGVQSGTRDQTRSGTYTRIEEAYTQWVIHWTVGYTLDIGNTGIGNTQWSQQGL